MVTKDSSGCSSVADTVVVTVGTDLPSPDAGSDATIDCNNTSATIGTSAVSGFSYQWSPSTGLSSTTVAQPTATPNTTTTYSLVVTEIATGCSGADTVVVTVGNDLPAPDAGSDATIDCNNTNATIGSSAQSGFTYAWSPSTGLSSTTVAQPTATPSSTTTYRLVITQLSTGCSGADTVVVTVDNDAPTANAGSDASIGCETTSVTIGASAVSGYTYAWTPTNGLNSCLLYTSDAADE